METRVMDLEQIAEQIGRRFDKIDARLDAIDKRFNGIDIRLDVIDKRLDGIDIRLDKLETRFDKLTEVVTGTRVDISELKGRIAYVPTIWQTITLVVGILGGAFMILKFGLHGSS